MLVDPARFRAGAVTAGSDWAAGACVELDSAFADATPYVLSRPMGVCDESRFIHSPARARTSTAAAASGANRNRTRTNCVAANNHGFGFYELGYAPYYPTNSRIFNNIYYRNGIGMQLAANDEYFGQDLSVLSNNIIYEPAQLDAAGRPYFLVVAHPYLESHNNWDYADDTEIGSLMWWKPAEDVTVTDEDFVSLDVSELSRPRRPDGALPDIHFLHLAPGSDLIDAGVDVGQPYQGAAPDLGPFESDY